MYLSIKQLTQRYGVSPATIWRWVNEGVLPKPHKLGPATTRWHVDDLQAFESRAAAGR